MAGKADKADKYVKLDNVNDAIVNVLERTDCKGEHIDRVLLQIDGLPTVEASEDYISKEWVLDKIDEYCDSAWEAEDLAGSLNFALENAPPAIPHISRNEMIKWLQNLKKDIGKMQHQDLWHYAEMLDEVINAIENRARGKWESRDLYSKKCSVCGEQAPYSIEKGQKKAYPHFSNFCPNCGADMR